MNLHDFFGSFKEDNKMDMHKRWAIQDRDVQEYIIKYSGIYGSLSIGVAKKVIYDPNAGVTVVL